MNDAIKKKAVVDFLDKEIEEISGRWASFEISRRALERAIAEKEISVTTEMKDKATEVRNLLEGMKEDKKKEKMETLPKEDMEAFNKVNEFENQKQTLEGVLKNITPVVEFLEITKAFKSEVEGMISEDENGVPSPEDGVSTAEQVSE